MHTIDESDYTPLHDHSISVQPVRRTCFTLNIIDDRAVEGNETFTLSLSAPASGLHSGISINDNYNGTVMKIVDNDST